MTHDCIDFPSTEGRILGIRRNSECISNPAISHFKSPIVGIMAASTMKVTVDYIHSESLTDSGLHSTAQGAGEY